MWGWDDTAEVTGASLAPADQWAPLRAGDLSESQLTRREVQGELPLRGNSKCNSSIVAWKGRPFACGSWNRRRRAGSRVCRTLAAIQSMWIFLPLKEGGMGNLKQHSIRYTHFSHELSSVHKVRARQVRTCKEYKWERRVTLTGASLTENAQKRAHSEYISDIESDRLGTEENMWKKQNTPPVPRAPPYRISVRLRNLKHLRKVKAGEAEKRWLFAIVRSSKKPSSHPYHQKEVARQLSICLTSLEIEVYPVDISSWESDLRDSRHSGARERDAWLKRRWSWTRRLWRQKMGADWTPSEVWSPGQHLSSQSVLRGQEINFYVKST